MVFSFFTIFFFRVAHGERLFIYIYILFNVIKVMMLILASSSLLYTYYSLAICFTNHFTTCAVVHM